MLSKENIEKIAVKQKKPSLLFTYKLPKSTGDDLSKFEVVLNLKVSYSEKRFVGISKTSNVNIYRVIP